MTNELALVMLLSRSEFDIYNKRRIAHLLKTQINWYEVLNISIEKKTAYLVYKNLHKLNYTFLVPSSISDYWQTSYQGNIIRNRHLLKVNEKLNEKFTENNIPLYPIRGIALLQNVYEDAGERFLSDIDFLVPPDFIKQAQGVMLKADARVLYKNDTDVYFNTSPNLCTSLFYAKINVCGSDSLDTFDFSFGFSNLENNKLMDFFIRCFSENLKSQKYHIAHYLILCIGFYEAMKTKKFSEKLEDINIAKLIDIYRYYTKFITQTDPTALTDAIAQLKISECMDYVARCLTLFYERKI